MDHHLRGLTSSVDLRRDGVTAPELRRWERTAQVVRIRRGLYLPTGHEALGSRSARHRVDVVAALHDLGPGAVASHGSAAAVHGLPTWGVGLQRVHVTRTRRSGARRGRLVHVHAARLEDDEVVTTGDGTPVTSPARTVVDVARSAPFEVAVCVADAALRAGVVDDDGLARALDRASGRPGAPAARRAVGFADGGAESVGESRSRVALHRAGLPAPLLQHAVRDERGVLVARTDFAWPGRGVVGEFDGLAKYGRLLRAGWTSADAVVAEKVREDRVRDLGLRVVRWTWAELDPFTPVHGRLLRAFDAVA